MPQPLHDALADHDAERALLAAVQATPALAWQLAGLLRAEMFHDAGHADAYTLLATAAQAERPVPRVTEAAPAPDPLAAAGRIRDLATLRVVNQRLQLLGQQVTRAAAGDLDAAAVLAGLEAAVADGRAVHGAGAAAALTPAAADLAAIVADVRERAERRVATGSSVMGIPTGFPRLDDLLNGLEPGLILLAGKPGMGKTTLANLIAANVAGDGVPVLYASYENSRANLIIKHLCRLAGVPEIAARRGLANPQTLAAAAVSFAPVGERLYYVEPTAATTIEALRGLALQVRRRHDAPRCLVILDYLQKAAAAAGYDELRANVGAIAAHLRDLSRALDSPVLALASLNRAGYATEGSKPTMGNLKESGDLEYGADVVLLLSEGEASGPPLGDGKPVTLRVEKNRGGPSGETVPLVFKPSAGDFREQAPARMVGGNGRRS